MKDKSEKERKELNRKLICKTFVSQMQKTFNASLCKNGILGGWIVISEGSVTYRTGKVSIPEKYRNLEMRYSDILSITKETFFLMPAVTFKMKNDEEYKFIVFSRKRFLEMLEQSRERWKESY